jgi:hypothetical protein
MAEETTLAQVIFSPPVLLTFLVCLLLAAVGIWLALWWQRRSRDKVLTQQRTQQEGTIERLLSSFGADKEQLIREQEALVAQRDARIAALERENARLRDRLTSSGLLGVFGSGKREVVSALLLENEQLHELLAQKQEQMRDLMADMTGRLMDRFDEQAQESARAVRYKQALLSAFLQQQETRQLLDRLIADGKVEPAPPSAASPPQIE